MVKIARVHSHGVARLSRLVTPNDVNAIVSNIGAKGYGTYNNHYVSLGVVEDETFIYMDMLTVTQRQAESRRKYAGKSLTQSIAPMLHMAGFKVSM